MKKGLRYGDIKLIAEATGLAEITVRKTLDGERNNLAVKLAAEQLTTGRAAVIQQIKRITPRKG